MGERRELKQRGQGEVLTRRFGPLSRRRLRDRLLGLGPGPRRYSCSTYIKNQKEMKSDVENCVECTETYKMRRHGNVDIHHEKHSEMSSGFRGLEKQNE